MPNYNEKTGIAYGVVSGNSVPYLTEEIFTHGDDLVYKEAVEELKGEFTQAWDEYNKNNPDSEQYEPFPSTDIEEELKYIYNNHCLTPYPEGKNITDADIDELVDDCMEWSETDQVSVTYKDGDYTYYMTTLGGAIIIYVIESPYVCYAKQCSPCVPGAGDLDSISKEDDPDSVLCYCVNPDDFDDSSGDNFLKREYRVRNNSYLLVEP